MQNIKILYYYYRFHCNVINILNILFTGFFCEKQE